MATTVNTARTRTSTNGRTDREARPRVRASGRNDRAGETRDRQYDLLTAALLGLAVGAGTALLLRRGPGGDRPIGPAWRAARSGARAAGRGMRFAWDRGVDAWERVPREEIEEHAREYLASARDTIDQFVHSELKDLRRAIRRQRKRLGI